MAQVAGHQNGRLIDIATHTTMKKFFEKLHTLEVWFVKSGAETVLKVIQQ